MAVQHLCITVRFLQPLSHGRGEGGEPEWPPSPLRLFQALVAASAGRWNERLQVERAAAALRWLEQQRPPTIIAPRAVPARAKYRLYVPDNVGDKVAGSWARGGEASIADFRTEKDVRPVYLHGNALHYLYPLADGNADFAGLQPVLVAAAQSITHLGWGIDMVAATASVLSDDQMAGLCGQRWLPTEEASAASFRVPIPGTLTALMRKHEAHLDRIGAEGFRPVPPLSAFQLVGYRRATDPLRRPYAAFALLKPDASGYRSFDPLRRTRDVAGMVRHAVAEAARRDDWPADEVNVFVHGKTLDGRRPTNGATSPNRFSYLPLPTINHKLRRVESIRRVLVSASPGEGPRIDWVRKALAGEELTSDDARVSGLLTILPGSDWVLRQYVGHASDWSTVTPLILPRHEGYDTRDAEAMIRLAFEQAGFHKDLLRDTELEWRRVGFFAGAELASRYLPPDNLKHKPRYHVRVRFPHRVQGPIAVGSGRFRGFGLFAVAD